MNLLICALANWRIAHLLASQEAGPFNCLHWLRHKVGVKHDSNNQPYPTNAFAELFTCVWCMSLWTGSLLTLFILVSPKWTKRILLPFALSTIAIVLEEKI